MLGCTVVLKTKEHKGGVKKKKPWISLQFRGNVLTYFYLLRIPFKLSENPNAWPKPNCASETNEEIPKQPATSFIKDTSSSMIEFLTSCFLSHWVWRVKSHFYELFLPSVVTSGKHLSLRKIHSKKRFTYCILPLPPNSHFPKHVSGNPANQDSVCHRLKKGLG